MVIVEADQNVWILAIIIIFFLDMCLNNQVAILQLSHILVKLVATAMAFEIIRCTIDVTDRITAVKVRNIYADFLLRALLHEF